MGIENGSAFVKAVVNDIESHANELKSATDRVLTVMPANAWIEQSKRRPIPRMLFSELWHEEELAILFADTNVGKSILAVQIGDSISRGLPIHFFRLEAAAQKVIYFDFELSEKQFEARYSEDFQNHFRFHDNFLRSEINSDSAREGNIEEYIHDAIEQALIEHSSKILIIDNITYLRNETEKAKDALPLMKSLKKLKKKHGLSILCLAHTPKRDMSKPITRNDLQGSKMLINFCDSAFALGESHKDKGIRYIKQIKARNTDIIYDSENVILCLLSKESNFLEFKFLDYGDESDHLRIFSDTEKAQRKLEARQLKATGLSNVEIGKRFGVSEAAIRKWLKVEPFEPIEPGSKRSNGSSHE